MPIDPLVRPAGERAAEAQAVLPDYPGRNAGHVKPWAAISAYHPSHVARLLHALGWSRQKPTRRARQRNEEAVQEWQEERLPALKKRP